MIRTDITPALAFTYELRHTTRRFANGLPRSSYYVETLRAFGAPVGKTSKRGPAAYSDSGYGSGLPRHKHDTVVVWDGRVVWAYKRGDRLGVERGADGTLRWSYS